MPGSPQTASVARWLASTFEQYLEFGSAGLSTEDAVMLRRVRSFGLITVVLVSIFGAIMPALNQNWTQAYRGVGLATAIALVLGIVHRNGRTLRATAHVTAGFIALSIFGTVLESGTGIQEVMIGGSTLVIASTTYVLGVRAAAAWTVVLAAATVAVSMRITPVEGLPSEQAAGLITLFAYRVIVLGAIWGISALGRRFADEQARRLQFLASHDPLTGLLNRHAFEDRVVESVARSRRRERYFGLIFLDLDRFKEVNDRFGHGVGDDALCVVADRIEGITRESDAACRLGGDEFLVLIEDADEAKAIELTAERLVQLISHPIVVAGEPIELSASAGVAIYPDDAVDAEALLHLADEAMYDSKSSGGDRSGRATRLGQR